VVKQHGVFFLFPPLCHLVRTRDRRRRAGSGVLADVSAFSLGAVVPFVAACAIIAWAGAFDNCWFWTLQYAREYVSETSYASAVATFRLEFSKAAAQSEPLWWLAGVGLVGSFADARMTQYRWLVGALCECSLLAVAPGPCLSSTGWP